MVEVRDTMWWLKTAEPPIWENSSSGLSNVDDTQPIVECVSEEGDKRIDSFNFQISGKVNVVVLPFANSFSAQMFG